MKTFFWGGRTRGEWPQQWKQRLGWREYCFCDIRDSCKRQQESRARGKFLLHWMSFSSRFAVIEEAERLIAGKTQRKKNMDNRNRQKSGGKARTGKKTQPH